MNKVANLIQVKVYPKDLKSIPDILPYNQLLHGEPVEMELDKKEIQRCMNFGDVFDLTTGEEVLIDEVAFKAIEEFVEKEEASEEESEEDPEPVVPEQTEDSIEEPTVDPQEPTPEPQEPEDIDEE